MVFDFTLMDHKLLTTKLSHCGFNVISVEWVKSYPKDRAQVTKVGIETPSPLIRDRCVPQVLHNNLCLCGQCSHNNCGAQQYAYNSQLHLPYSPNIGVNSDLVNISWWSTENGLQLLRRPVDE